MKSIKILFLLAAGFTAQFATAQTELEKGSITMELTEINSDNAQMAAQLEMLKGTQTKYFFNAEKSMMQADMMGGMIKMTTLVQNSDEHLTFLFDAMGNKMMVEASKDERKEFEEQQNEMMDGVEIVYDESATKEILGHKVIKATLKSENDDLPMTFTMWVAPGIKASNKLIQGMQALDLKGFPLEYVMEMENMSMTYTTTALETDIDPEIFKLNTAGYKKMSFDEFQQQMGQMGGGMGF